MPVKLTPRLETAVPYIRKGRLTADIGTDHAYLPIYLCEAGILTPTVGRPLCAIAADINRGPVERAELHIRASGMSDRIKTVLTDGLHGLEDDSPDDIIIFGMGGELIAAILSEAPWVRSPEKRLILQPMTHAEKLREYLFSAGFTIVGETLSREGERIYQTLCAEWSGSPTVPRSVGELAVGAPRHRAGEEQQTLYAALIQKTLRTEVAARDARAGAGLDTAEADRLIASLCELREGLAPFASL